MMTMMILPAEGSASNLLYNAQLEKVQCPLLLGLSLTTYSDYLKHSTPKLMDQKPPIQKVTPNSLKSNSNYKQNG